MHGNDGNGGGLEVWKIVGIDAWRHGKGS